MKLANRSRRGGFTLVEVLIVVVMLGLLAATVLPQLTQASKDAKETSLVQNLQMIRHQISLYKLQHDGTLPAQGTSDATTFTNQLMNKTDLDGTVNVATEAFGPYLLGHVLANPYTDVRTVKVVNGALAVSDYDGSGAHGWAYSSTTGELRGNVASTIMSIVETTKPVNSF